MTIGKYIEDRVNSALDEVWNTYPKSNTAKRIFRELKWKLFYAVWASDSSNVDPKQAAVKLVQSAKRKKRKKK